jgi:hypothetical protein
MEEFQATLGVLAAIAPLMRLSLPLMLAVTAGLPLCAQLVSYEGFGDYAAGEQVESGESQSEGDGLNAGAGWDGPYNISNAIKQLVLIENRSSNPVNYVNDEITISGGIRALRFYDIANSSYALRRPLGTVFSAAAGDTLWFSVLFRTASGGDSPLSNQDFFQIGFDSSENPTNGNPRVSIGANTTESNFPSPFRFFARSTTDVSNSDFHEGVSIAAGTTYLLVARIQAHAGTYNSVSLFVNPSSLAHPGPPSAEVVLPSGLNTLSHLFIRTVRLDPGDAYVLDECHIGRDYGSVVQSFDGALRLLPTSLPNGPLTLRWPVSPADIELETSTTLSPESWMGVTGTFQPQGAEWELLVPIEPGTPRRFFRLKR